jgi:single-strand DNA-binding protein
MSVNKAILVGNLGADPEIRTGSSGRQIASFSLATNKRWTDRTTGEKNQSTEWHRVAVFAEGLVKIVSDYARKGSRLYVEGEIRTRKWTDRGGIERYTTEIVVDNFSGMIVLLDRKETVPPAESSADYGGDRSPSLMTTYRSDAHVSISAEERAR